VSGPADAFPRGLAQPATGFRFGLDALLLACFLPQGPRRLLDLGTGCGAVALGWLLRGAEGRKKDLGAGGWRKENEGPGKSFPRREGDWEKAGPVWQAEPSPGLTAQRLKSSGPGRAVGLELDAEMVACARENAERLGLAERFEIALADVRAACNMHNMRNVLSMRSIIEPESFDLVACNPPYHEPGSGRLPEHPGRRAALFSGLHNDSSSLADFAAAAAYALPQRGRACFVFPAGRTNVLLATLSRARLEPKRLKFVHAGQDRPARLLLAEARKDSRPGAVVEPPLFLYKDGMLTRQALAFCPFLSCNPGASPKKGQP